MRNFKLLYLAIHFCIQPIFAQTTVELEIDSKIRKGILENGFTYYIRENRKPEARFEMRLAVKAGSILEEDNQQGLAHFAEHMCFNGTKNFEKNDLIKYLESMGIEFGPEINAYTSFDKTVYKLSIPSDSTVLVDKGFLIMEDWAQNVSFTDEEIDKERGVVIEEWRIGRGPNQRMLDKFLPVVFKDSRYAERLPIGKKEILESFEYETIRSFYRDWYRPDLMALVVVGDIDADLVEEKIKEHFSRLKMPEKPRERIQYDIPDHEGTLVSIATDKEAPYSVIRLIYKSEAFKVETESEYLKSMKHSFVAAMLNRRLAELTESADPPFVGAGFYYGSMYSPSKNAFQGYALVSETGVERGLQSLLEENNRIAQYGFTEGELNRYKLDYLKRMEQLFNEKDKTESETFADEYVRNFTEDEPIPGIEKEYEIVKNNIDGISLEDINVIAKNLITTSNRIIVVIGLERDDLNLPDENGILALAEKTDKAKLEPYKDLFSSTELMEEFPESGTIVKEKYIKPINAYELKLSNGITVMLKPTDFKNDEILMTAFAWGGTSIYDEKDHFTALNSSGIIAEAGVANYSNSDLKKVLAGKTVHISASIGREQQNLSGKCRPTDLETMLQLAYLRFTNPRIDEESFQSYISKHKSYYKNLAQEPVQYFYDKYNRIKAQNHPRGNYLPKEEDWDKIDYKRVVEIYKERFSNASEYTFVFVGAFEIDSIKPLIATYIGSLPSTSSKSEFRDLGIRPPSAKTIKNIHKGSDEKSIAIVTFHKESKYNIKDAFLFSQLSQHLKRKYYEKLREEMSGIYGVRVSGSLAKIPYNRAELNITIPCSPDNVDSLVFAAISEIRDVQQNGVSEEDINKLKEIEKRNKEEKLQENGYWLGALKYSYTYNRDFANIASFDIIEEISSKSIQKVANKYINPDTYLQVVLYPEKTE